MLHQPTMRIIDTSLTGCTVLDHMEQPRSLTPGVLKTQVARNLPRSSVTASCNAGALPGPLEQRVRQQALTVNELLRHFWAAMPLELPGRQQKAQRMADELQVQKA